MNDYTGSLDNRRIGRAKEGTIWSLMIVDPEDEKQIYKKTTYTTTKNDRDGRGISEKFSEMAEELMNRGIYRKTCILYIIFRR